VTERLRVIVVSDPLCSWCWGTAAALDVARSTLAREVDFDVLLGGINVDSHNPVGAYGRLRLARLWREVHEVTGQPFASAPSREPFVYNSTLLCAVLEAVRDLRGEPPFDLLRRLQEGFFARGENVTSVVCIEAILRGAGEDAALVLRHAQRADVQARTWAGFERARSHGTHAMPNLVLDDGGARRLLAGGYLDAPTLVTTIEGAIRRSSPPRA
jgi:putative protein-disulfide isomerase